MHDRSTQTADSVSSVLFTLMWLIALFACGPQVGSDPEGSSRDPLAGCAERVRKIFAHTDSLSDGSAKIAALEKALSDLTGDGTAHCERELLVELADLHARAGNTEQLVTICDRALRPEIRLSPEQTAGVKLLLSQAYFQAGVPRSYDLARDVFLYLDSMHVRSGQMLKATELLVHSYELTGDLKEVGTLLQDALVKAREEGDILWACDLLDRLGMLAMHQGEAFAAVRMHKQSLSDLDHFFRNGGVRDTLVHHIYERARQSGDGTVGSSDTVSVLHTEGTYLRRRQGTLVLLGNAFRVRNESDSATVSYASALDIANNAGLEGIVPPFVEHGEVLLQKADVKGAIRNGEMGFNNAVSAGDHVRTGEAASLLYKAYKRSGDSERALHMLEMASAYIDSVDNESFKMGLLKKQVTYDARDDSLNMAASIVKERTARTIAQLEAKNSRNRAIVIGGSALFVLAGGGLLFRADRKRRRARFERDAAQLEMHALRAQMNPHFIFNALNSINSYVQANDRDLASGFLTKFARLMRLVLENSRHAEVPLSQDLEALRLYMDLERARMQEKFDYTIDVDAAIDQEITMVPPLVMQPFVENAIWHGISRKEGKGHIKLSVVQKDARLVMTVEDNGVGRQPTANPPADGAPPKISLGTTITRDRLAMLGKQRGGEAGFRFTDLELGTRVEVEMPLMVEA